MQIASDSFALNYTLLQANPDAILNLPRAHEIQQPQDTHARRNTNRLSGPMTGAGIAGNNEQQPGIHVRQIN